MGNLVSQDPSIVLPGEPDAPSTYWLAALDVFETGENLPSRIGGNGLDNTEDWRMAIVWGRTLVCLADEKVTHNMKVAKEQAQASSAASGDFCYYPMGSAFPMSEPHWPPSSPFHAIAQFRPPVTRNRVRGSHLIGVTYPGSVSGASNSSFVTPSEASVYSFIPHTFL